MQTARPTKQDQINAIASKLNQVVQIQDELAATIGMILDRLNIIESPPKKKRTTSKPLADSR